MNDTLFYGGLITYLIFTLSLLTVLTVLKWYRPRLRLGQWFSLSCLFIIIAGLGVLQILSSYTITNSAEEKQTLAYYKVAAWLQQEEETFTVLAAHSVWEQSPTTDAKYLLAMAYANNEQWGKAGALLEELSVQAEHSRFVDTAEVRQALQALREQQQASSTHLDASVAKGSAARKAVVSISSSGQQGSEGQQAGQVFVREQMEKYSRSLRKAMKWSERELELLAFFDLERVQYAAGREGWTHASSNTHYFELYEQVKQAIQEGEIKDPLVLKTVAANQMFFGEEREAERQLLQTLLFQPHDHEAAAMLSELYLSGRVTPGASASQLPQYQQAVKRMSREQVQSFQEIVLKQAEEMEQDIPQETGAKRTTEDRIFDARTTLANELAYMVVAPIASRSSTPELDVRLSRYYFNKGDQARSLAYINDMREKTDQLTTYQKQVIHNVASEDQAQSLEVMDDGKRERVYHWRQEAFDMLHTPRLHEHRTIEDQSYAYHLSEKLRLPDMKRIAITSIDATEAGEITMYVQTDNVDQLKASQLSLMDNQERISSFSLVKLSESVNETRAINLVIDSSGSMSGNRIEAARTAATSFVRNLKSFEQAELIRFNSSPSVVQALTSNKGALVEGAVSLTADGGTDITQALRFAMNRFGSVNGQRIIFIFSDGEDAEFSQAATRASLIAAANRQGMPVYAVGFGAGYETLSEVAERTGGMFIAAPNAATILSGFDEVARTLEQTYKITYKLDSPAPGKHIVELAVVNEDLTASRTYYIGEEEGIGEDRGAGPSDGFEVEMVSPNAIQRAKTGWTKVTLSGSGFNELSEIRIDKMKLSRFQVQSDTLMTVRVPSDLNIGEYELTLTAKDGRKTTAAIEFIEPGLMDSIKFGWATVYGRSIKQDKGTYQIVGDPTVDHFIYPADPSDAMELKDGKELQFRGIRLAVDQTRMPIAARLALDAQQELNNALLPTFTMTLNDYGENFDLSYYGLDHLTISKLGLEFQLANITYKAHRDERPGTLQAKSGLAGWSNVTDLVGQFNLPKMIKLPKLSDQMITATVQSDKLGIAGSAQFPSLGMNDMFEVRQPSLSISYDFGPNRLMITGGISNVWVMKKQLVLRGVDGADLTLGWENSLMPKAYGLTLHGSASGGVPLGQTGLTVNKLGALLDFTSGRAGSLDAGFGTVIDRVRPFVEKLNSFKIFGFKPFDIDASKISLLNLDASLGVQKFATKDWEATGQTQVKVLGFSVDERRFRLNRSLMEFGMSMDILVANMDGTFTVIYDDPRINDYLTLNYAGNLEAPFVDLDAKWIVVPARIDSSAISYTGKAAGFDVDFSLGELEVFY